MRSLLPVVYKNKSSECLICLHEIQCWAGFCAYLWTGLDILWNVPTYILFYIPRQRCQSSATDTTTVLFWRPYFVTQTCYSSILSISICSSVLWDAVKLAAGKKKQPNFRMFDPRCFYINLFLFEARFLRCKAGFTNHAEGATSPGPQTSRGPTTSCFTVGQLHYVVYSWINLFNQVFVH